MGQQDDSLLFGVADIGGDTTSTTVDKDGSPGEVQTITGSLLIDRAAGTPIWIYVDQTELTSLTTEDVELQILSATASGGSFSEILRLQLGTGTELTAKGLGSVGAVGILPQILASGDWLRAIIIYGGTPSTGIYRVGLGLQETSFMKILA